MLLAVPSCPVLSKSISIQVLARLLARLLCIRVKCFYRVCDLKIDTCEQIQTSRSRNAVQNKKKEKKTST